MECHWQLEEELKDAEHNMAFNMRSACTEPLRLICRRAWHTKNCRRERLRAADGERSQHEDYARVVRHRAFEPIIFFLPAQHGTVTVTVTVLARPRQCKTVTLPERRQRPAAPFEPFESFI